MSPDDRQAIIEVIEKTVNGKIDRIEKKIDTHNTKHEEDMVEVREHIKEVKPILNAYNGGKTLGDFFKWFAGVGVAWLLIQNWFSK